MTWLLLVTWFMPSQPPHSYRAAFDSSELCETAENELQTDADKRRIESENIFKQHADPKTGFSPVPPPPYPKLSAICVLQKISN
jgi:hypothetical protein